MAKRCARCGGPVVKAKLCQSCASVLSNRRRGGFVAMKKSKDGGRYVERFIPSLPRIKWLEREDV